MIVAITGASGSLGGRLCDHLVRRGWTVRALVRDPATFAKSRPGVPAARCDLPDTLDTAALAGADALVHAAYPTRLTDVAAIRRVNEDGTRRLIDAARAAGVAQLVFVSSLVAAPDAPSYYARGKHALEALFEPARDAVVRPGLVIARESHGLFQQMRDAMRRTHALPVFDGGRQPLQTVHVDDVCEAIARTVERRLAGSFNVAEPEPVTFRAFLRMIARGLGVRCILVPLPFAPVLAGVRAVEALGVPFPLRSESLLGIRALRRVAVEADLRRLDLRVRPVAESLADVLSEPLSGPGPSGLDSTP